MKGFLGPPSSILNTIFRKIMMNTVQESAEARGRSWYKYREKSFGPEVEEEAQANEIAQVEIFIKDLPQQFQDTIRVCWRALHHS